MTNVFRSLPARRVEGLAAVLFVTLLAALTAPGEAFAAGPAWRLDALANSTVNPGETLEYWVQATNVGQEDMTGAPIVISATLPAGVTATSAEVFTKPGGDEAHVVPCTAGDGSSPVSGAHDLRCVNSYPLPKGNVGLLNYQLLKLLVTVDSAVTLGSSLVSSFSVEGGGAPPAATLSSVTVASSPPSFGVATFDAAVSNASGNPEQQAGAHPADVRVWLDLNSATDPLTQGAGFPVAPPKDISVELPAGLVGDPNAAPKCTFSELTHFAGVQSRTACPTDAQIGTIVLRSNNTPLSLAFAGPYPLFNMVPPRGVPAQLAFYFEGTTVVLNTHLNASGGYRISLGGSDISEALPVSGLETTVWGVPADPSHDAERACQDGYPAALGGTGCSSSATARAFLRNPTSCGGESLEFVTAADPWTDPGAFTEPVSVRTHLAPGYPAPSSEWGEQVGATGCELVPFEPSLTAEASTARPDSPSGLALNLTIPQSDDSSRIAQADLKKLVMRFPAGMTVNPAAANGLQGCSEAQIGLGNDQPAACPNSSKLGTVQVKTPLLEEPLTGALYLAAQDQNPFHSILATYLVVEGSGVVIKLPGKLEADPHTGQLTSIFDNNPQLPFSKLHLELFGGTGASLATPSTCGSAPFSSELTGWNGTTVSETSGYTVECAPGLGAFAPAFTAGTTGTRAGAFSPFVLSFSRQDGEQSPAGLSFTFPSGVDANVTGVPRCPDALAATGECPASSRIGSVTVASGVGSELVFLKGTVYFTGPYKGGPFGDVVVVPAVAGPFNLGNVVVRGSIRVNPQTVQPTVVSDPFPQFVGSTGIPTDIRRVDVNLDRPGFTYNATNCSPGQVTATLTGDKGTVATVAMHYQPANCATLAFHPRFSASTRGNGTFNHNGASLDVRITTHQGATDPAGTPEANIRKVEVQLPKKLPARLTTLQKACTESQFAANPADCPAASDVGTAVAHTPILKSPLSGPAYLVSHGGEAFPDLVLILQGEGITLQVTGHTQIRNGITYSRFETVPDAPVSSFELSLPESPTSALAATESLCSNTRTVTVRKRVVVHRHGRTRHVTRSVRRLVTEPLAMPTTITAQNGAVLKQTTRIAVTGCPKAHTNTHRARRARRR